MTKQPSFPSRIRTKVRGLGRADSASGADDRLVRLRKLVNEHSAQVKRLDERIKELDDELLDARSQGRRIGEISDLVTELLVSEASRRDPEFQRIVDRYLSE